MGKADISVSMGKWKGKLDSKKEWKKDRKGTYAGGSSLLSTVMTAEDEQMASTTQTAVARFQKLLPHDKKDQSA